MKQKRISLPVHTVPVEYRIRQLRKELGLNTFESVWHSMCVEMRLSQKSNNN